MLKREINTTDPWLEMEKYMPGESVNLDDEKANEPFTVVQVEHITKSLDIFKIELKKAYSPSQAQEERINQKLDYLIDRSRKMGRIDWKNIFIGQIVGIGYDLAMNPEHVGKLWSLVAFCFKGILYLAK